MAVAEPVERRVAQLLIDRNGYVLSGDHEALNLFQIDSIDKFNGIDVQMLIPAIQLPDADTSFISKNIRKQKATGKTQDGVAFPLCLMISFQDSGTDTTDSGLSNPSANLYVVTLWVYTNLSGLLVINEHSIVESCNHHFSMLMFGYPQNHIVGESITKIIPNFGQEYEYLGYIRSRNATLSSLDNDESETETDQINLGNKINELDMILNDNNTDTVPRRASNDAKMCLDFTSKSNNISNDVQNGSIMHTVNSEPIDISSKANNTRYDDFKYMNPIEGRRRLESPCSNINKSFSDNILCSGENGENNKNVANVYKPLDYSDISYKYNIRLNSECDIQNQLHPQTLLQHNECDLLTPVNDNVDIQNMIMIPNKVGSTTLQSQETNVSDQKYTSADISAALRVPQESSIENSVEYSKNTPKNKIKKVVTDNKNYITSTPEIKKIIQASNMVMDKKQYTDGKYKGEAIHYDGNIIDIIYTISTQILPCDKKVYCVWIHRDPDSEFNLDEEEKHQNLTLTFNSVASTVDNSLGQAIKVTAAAASGSVSASIGAQNSSRPNSVSLVSQCEEDQVCGEYSKYYTTLKQIGKGAYGYVKMAYRNSDRLLVISKFILKEKLCPNFMIITDDDKKEIPMEIYLLTHVQHPNIVSVYDVFENEKFFQLVMEKHGSGMDLFEFIDRRPLMDEKLGCFIFRQIANAVDYLHKLNILHRDIKDENIIIDQNFHVKLIDFGSATFMQEGKLFSTFYGTTEYCSPEVLAGNKYAGPELEVWSLGVTLYVLMFFENPFLDIEETLRANLVLPHTISAPLEALLFSMLDKDPKTRCTMKQLMQNDWLNPEIVTTNQSFAWIVPCEQFEANPEKFYTGQAYSSMIALSESPHDDSLSLADDDSMIDDEEDKSLPSQTDRDSIKGLCLDFQLTQIVTNSNVSVDISSVLDTKICQLSSTIGNIHIDKDFSTTPATATSPMIVNNNSSGNLYNVTIISNCNNKEKMFHENDINLKHKIRLYDNFDTTDCSTTVNTNTSSNCISINNTKKNSNINNSFKSRYRNNNHNINNKTNKNLLFNPKQRYSIISENLNYSTDMSNAAMKNSNLLNSYYQMSNKSPIEINTDLSNITPSTSTATISVSNSQDNNLSSFLTSSKSENNIFEYNLTTPSTTYDAASLNDINEIVNFSFPSHYGMNDLSKTQTLNKLSDD